MTYLKKTLDGRLAAVPSLATGTGTTLYSVPIMWVDVNCAYCDGGASPPSLILELCTGSKRLPGAGVPAPGLSPVSVTVP